MSRTMWFGPRGALKRIKVMQAGGSHSPVGYSESAQYLSGRAGVRRSFGSHMEYDLSWRGMRDQVQHLLDCSSGMYGRGPFYFIDPMWSDKNCLAAHWSAPFLGTLDAPVIYGEKRPEEVPAPVNNLGLPLSGARYVQQVGSLDRFHYVPIPHGSTLHFGYVGTAGAISIQPTLRTSPSGAAVTPAATTPTNTSFTTTSIASSIAIDGVEIRVVVPSGSVDLFSMQAQVIASGESSPVLAFQGGRGNVGVQFDNHPSVTPYSRPYDSIGLTAKLIEVDE